LARDALATAEELKDKDLIALAIHLLGLIELTRQRPAQALPLMTQALALWQELGLKSDVGMASMVLGQIRIDLGEPNQATSHIEQALNQFRAVGHASGAAFSLSLLACLAADRGDTSVAARDYFDALVLWASLNELWAISRALTGLAAIAVTQGQPETAAFLLGAMDARLQQSGSTVFPMDRRNHDLAVESARDALGDKRFTELHTRGRSLSLQETVDLASSITVSESPDTTLRSQNSLHGGLLTNRELEVLRLIAVWRTDQEIADELFISRRTVNTHVANILAKLGVSNRRNAVALMQERGLLPQHDENTRHS
jgi:non-specific serine/threonine protein kinase